jgi:hypothetical protein
MSLPGIANPAAGRNVTGAGTGPGSRPGPFTPTGIDAGANHKGPVAVESFGASVTAPKNGKMVYILVAVLIAAICVLAILLFSGGTTPTSAKARDRLELQAAPPSVPVTSPK